MKTITRSYGSQRGFTLVELMVASVIGLLLLAGIIQIFVSNRATSRLQDAVANVQENGRFALDFLTKDIRMAGYMGCVNSNTVQFTNDLKASAFANTVVNTVGSFNGQNSFIGYTYASGSALPAGLLSAGFNTSPAPDATTIVPDTDVIEIESAQSCPGAQVVCDNAGANTINCPTGGTLGSDEYKLASNNSCNLSKNDIVLISDCSHADLHSITNVVGGNGTTVNVTHSNANNSTGKLSVSYGNGAAVYRMATTFYYIGYSTANPAETALRRLTLQGDQLVSQELVDGVYDMQILYGVDTDGDKVPNRYADATTVTANSNWGNVITARVTLSVRSAQDNVLSTPTSYTYNGVANTPTRRLLRTFTTTIKLRNRLPLS